MKKRRLDKTTYLTCRIIKKTVSKEDLSVAQKGERDNRCLSVCRYFSSS